jgi:hypothetical protein
MRSGPLSRDFRRSELLCETVEILRSAQDDSFLGGLGSDGWGKRVGVCRARIASRMGLTHAVPSPGHSDSERSLVRG